MKYSEAREVEIIHNSKKLILDNVLIDTGSGGTLFKMDKVEEIDITIDMNDSIETIHGVGGSEFVYKKTIDEIRLNDLNLKYWILICSLYSRQLK